MSDPKLKVVEKPKPLPEGRNFWNVCPRVLDLLPTSDCDLGKPKLDVKGRVIADGACPWGINSKGHHYCFWKLVQERSAPDGQMEPAMQGEIAELIGCSPTKIHFIMKEAADKVRALHQADELKDLSIEEPAGSDSSHEVFIATEGVGDGDGDPEELL